MDVRISVMSSRNCEQVIETSDNALERTVRHRGPRLAAARATWPAAQLGR